MSILSELERVLKDEQEYLLSGNFRALEDLVKRKSHLADDRVVDEAHALAERLAAGNAQLPGEAYKRLAQQASHNETLLQSARLGLQAALSQLREASKAGEQSTYSRTGERRSMASSTSSITQKI